MKLRKRALNLFLAIALVLNFTALGVFAAEPTPFTDIVNIPDAKLKELLNAKIDDTRPADTDITVEEMKSVDYLYIDNDVKSLEGLHYAVNLKTLRVSGNVTDLDELTDLKNLESLTVENNDHLSDLSILGEKPLLKNLDIHYSDKLTSLNGLSYENFPNLTELNASRCDALNDISALSNFELKNLTTLDLESSDEIRDIASLKGYTSLSYLDIEKIEITDENRSDYKETISSLINLTDLHMPYCGITDEDTEMFSTLTQLKTLVLNINDLTKTDFCDHLPSQIETLSLFGNDITNMDNLKRLKNLKVLGLGDNQVTDFSFIKDLPYLTSDSIRHAEGDESFPFTETVYYGSGSSPIIIEDGKIVIENPYKDIHGQPISFENAEVTQGNGYVGNIKASYDPVTNQITISNISDDVVTVKTRYDIPLSDGDVKIGQVRLRVYVKEKDEYTIQYDWQQEAPEGVSLPTDSTIYDSLNEAKASIDTTYTDSTVIKGEKDGKEGIWTFSGWQISVVDHVVYARGQWTFEEHQHEWGTPVYDWSEDGKSVTATRICLEDENHVETETVEVVSEITTPATCTTKGETTYSATFTSDWAEKQTRVLENVDVLPHSYGTAWLSDDTNHWHECTECKTKTDVTAHTYVWVIDKEATETETGYQHQECNVCGHKKDLVEIPKLDVPQTPETPEKPETPETPVNPETPQTNDTANIGFWFLSGIIAVMAGFILKEKKNKETF